MPLPRNPAKPVTMILELPSLGWVRNSGECVGESVFGRGDPFRYDPILTLNFGGCDASGHPESLVVTRPTVGEEEESCLIGESKLQGDFYC